MFIRWGNSTFLPISSLSRQLTHWFDLITDHADHYFFIWRGFCVIACHPYAIGDQSLNYHLACHPYAIGDQSLNYHLSVTMGLIASRSKIGPRLASPAQL